MGSKAKMDPIIADEVPWSDQVTEYDEEHFITYLRLLDADAEGACKEEMARIVLGIDAAKNQSALARPWKVILPAHAG